MTSYYLDAGTDVAEMALFDIDALPQVLPRDAEHFAQLIAQERLILFPTGSDGGYLLQLFVNEAIPLEMMRYCLVDDKLTGSFDTPAGRIAFGGMESAYMQFKPNRNIRADGLIEPGRYAYTAYRTEFPDQLVMEALEVEQTSSERWLGRAPITATVLALMLAAGFAITRHVVLAGMVLLSGYLVARSLRRLLAYQELVARRHRAQLAFPSIIVEFWLS